MSRQEEPKKSLYIMRIATMQHPDIFFVFKIPFNLWSRHNLADRRGLHRPGGGRSSAPSGRGTSCGSGHAQWGDREAARRGESDSEGVVGF